MQLSSTSGAVAIIPVRMSSQRLPGKPLAEISGQTLVERVWRKASQCQTVSQVYVATDSEEIAEVVGAFGAEVVMTASSITTGSQRVAKAAQALGITSELIVNVQGDMPFIDPELIDRTVELARATPRWGMVTAATPIVEEAAFHSNSVVKVVIGGRGDALYFSRAAVPASRDGDRLRWTEESGEVISIYGYKHFGLYVFRPEVLNEFDSDELTPLESVEKLEQLRLLEQGVRIGVYVAHSRLTAQSIEVDTPADLAAAIRQSS
jgi:3-deoxy-manno-octulosonate cytidylyltransferase (CMP-KDO synthetase)